ncbi:MULTISPECIES: Asp23/Gls24 family envelope stress response protein [Oerskovia]|uniref:Asp23/Gls24 family envelope stress response protein n=1 Tax=Oerskovia gallyi TaxID=2762226 RepID=A0ABR8UYN3_9CELL|nr:Asp23/Gls24 family envelope stress response protein [Oerskovia gallyi]MBD7997356.1 Asp23/Gls24 family envelope stress response protein [Oerskovia gallyi]
MSEQSTPTTGATAPGTAARPGAAGQAGPPRGTVDRPSALASEHGSTTIADQVVAKIAGIATRNVQGVYAVGGGAARAFGAIREYIPGSGSDTTSGVHVEVGERQAAVDLDLVADYGVSIADLAQAVRRSVITSIERMTGLEVTEVNIDVNDVHLPGDDADSSSDRRSQREQSSDSGEGEDGGGRVR